MSFRIPFIAFPFLLGCIAISGVAPAQTLQNSHLSLTATKAGSSIGSVGGNLALNTSKKYLYISAYDGTVSPATQLCDRGYDTHSCNGVISVLTSGYRLRNRIELPGLNGTALPDPAHHAVWFLSDNAGLSYGASACGQTGATEPYSTVYSFKDDLSGPAPGIGVSGVFKTLPGVVASQAVLNSKTKRFYVSDECTGNVIIYDTAWNQLGTVTLGSVTTAAQSAPGFAGRLAVNAGTNKIYVSDLKNSSLHEIDGSTGAWSRTISLSRSCNLVGGCRVSSPIPQGDGVAVGVKANKVFVTHQADGSLAVVDVKNNYKVSVISLDSSANGTSGTNPAQGGNLVSVLEKKGMVLVSNWDQSRLTVISESTGAIIQTASLGTPDVGSPALTNNCYSVLSSGGSCASFGDNVQGLVVNPVSGSVYVSTLPVQGIWEAGAGWATDVAWYNATNPATPLSTTSSPLWGKGNLFVLNPTTH